MFIWDLIISTMYPAKHFKKNLPEKGFSVVELVVAIAVVLILLMLVVHMASNYRERATASASASNLRQIGAASLLYAASNQGQLPPVSHIHDRPWAIWVMRQLASGDGALWMNHGVLFSEGYLSDPRVLFSPAQQQPLFQFETYLPFPTASGGWIRKFTIIY